MKMVRTSKASTAVVALALFLCPSLGNANGATVVTISVVPFAFVDFPPGEPNMFVRVGVDGFGTYAGTKGTTFTVSGNANATLQAVPHEFMTSPSTTGAIGQAEKGADLIGYRMTLRFPNTFVTGSPVQTATLPGTEDPTSPPLTVDMTLTSGVREGRILLQSNPTWTPTGATAPLGDYTVTVDLLVTAN
jgi:hypothetical protein